MGAKFGQHFLIDDQIISHIVDSCDMQQPLVEVGPGRGALTLHFLKHAKAILLIEVDKDLQKYWSLKLSSYPHAKLLCADVLDLDWQEWVSWAQGKVNVVSNLPYEISGPFLIRLASNTELWNKALLMLQYEIVQKLISSPSNSNYSRLSVQLQRHCNIEELMIVYPSSFAPPPKVDSQLVMLSPKDIKYNVKSEACWEYILRYAFSHKRQMLRRIFKKYSIKWDELCIQDTDRPSDLSVEKWVSLCNYLFENNSAGDWI